MKSYYLLIYFLLSLVITSSAQNFKFPKDEFNEAVEITKIKKIDPKILAAYETTYKNKFEAVNPKKKFQSTDVSIDTKLPQRRLVFLLSTKKRHFLYYEHGGKYLHWHCITFIKKDNGELNPVVNINLPQRALTKNEFIECLLKGEYLFTKPAECQY